MWRFVLRWKISKIAGGAARLLRKHGVETSPWWFGAYDIDPKHLVFVLPVETDQVRDLLRADPEVRASLNALLERHNWPAEARPSVAFDIESAETVQRESNGHWWHHYK